MPPLIVPIILLGLAGLWIWDTLRSEKTDAKKSGQHGTRGVRRNRAGEQRADDTRPHGSRSVDDAGMELTDVGVGSGNEPSDHRRGERDPAPVVHHPEPVGNGNGKTPKRQGKGGQPAKSQKGAGRKKAENPSENPAAPEAVENGETENGEGTEAEETS